MASTHLVTNLTLDYLNDAAHLLRTSAVETSAHLMKQRNDLQLQYDMSPSPNQRQQVCGACGHIMIPGDGTILKLEPRLPVYKKRKQKPHQLQATGSVKTMRCGHCTRVTRTSLAAPEPVIRRKTKRTEHRQTEALEAPKVTTANASSKKRAKNRKAGLQALLGQQRQTANPLSLGDFMKK